MTGSELPLFPFDTPPELDAEPEYAQLRREDPVPKVRLPMGGQAYLVSRYVDVKRVLSDPVFSRAATSDPGVATLRPVRRNPYIMISLDAPEHTRVRRLAAPILIKGHSRRVRWIVLGSIYLHGNRR